MVLTPENSKKLPDKYKKALADKIQTVQAHIVDIPHDKATAIIHAQRQPERVFFLCEDITHPIIDYCRVIDIPHWAKENSMTSQQVSRLCACVQRHGIDSFKDLAPKAGEYLSQAHVLCDIVASIAFALSEAADTIPDEDTFINACKAAFTLSRRNSLGFGPSRNRHRKNTVAARKSRQENDDEESQKRYSDGDSISSNLLTKILMDISKDVYALLMEYKPQTKQFLHVRRSSSLFTARQTPDEAIPPRPAFIIIVHRQTNPRRSNSSKRFRPQQYCFVPIRIAISSHGTCASFHYSKRKSVMTCVAS